MVPGKAVIGHMDKKREHEEKLLTVDMAWDRSYHHVRNFQGDCRDTATLIG